MGSEDEDKKTCKSNMHSFIDKCFIFHSVPRISLFRSRANRAGNIKKKENKETLTSAVFRNFN